jgi:DNA-binding response OmpR family regulator
MNAPSVLVVEDDIDVRSLMATLLERAGYRVLVASDGEQCLRLFYTERPDLILLDVGLPGGLNGWQILERVRELSDSPVIMVTASTAELERVRGLQGGADDYVSKPFGSQELLARVAAVLRRADRSRHGEDEAEVVSDGFVEIDFPRRRVTVSGELVVLTPTEFKLLVAFARNPRQVLSRDQIMELVWGDVGAVSVEQVKLYVSYLRRKLTEVAAVDPIETVRGFGYSYDPDGPAPR